MEVTADLLDVFFGHRLREEPDDPCVEVYALALRVHVGCHTSHPWARDICIGAQLFYLYDS